MAKRYEGNPVIESIQGTWVDKFYDDGINWEGRF